MAIATVAAPPVRVKPSHEARIVEIRGTSYRAGPIASNCPDIIAAWRLLNLANGNAYDLAVSDQAGVSCDCPDFEFRHRDAGTLCKHARECIRAGLFDAADIALDGKGRVIGVRRRPAAVVQPTAPEAGISRPRDEFDEPTPQPKCGVCRDRGVVRIAAEAGPNHAAYDLCPECEPAAEPSEAELLECLADRPDPIAEAWNDGWRAALLAHGILN